MHRLCQLSGSLKYFIMMPERSSKLTTILITPYCLVLSLVTFRYLIYRTFYGGFQDPTLGLHLAEGTQKLSKWVVWHPDNKLL